MPWPPSANRYWRRVGNKTIISQDARLYIKNIKKLTLTWKNKKLNNRIGVEIQAYPPDKRKRDLDNTLKVILDSLEKAGFYDDDSQIDKIYIERKELVKPGFMQVHIYELEAGAND